MRMANREYSKEQEDFDGLIRQMIGEYRIKVDEAGWEQVSRQLNRRKMRWLTARVVSSMAAVAAMLILVFSWIKFTGEVPLESCPVIDPHLYPPTSIEPDQSIVSSGTKPLTKLLATASLPMQVATSVQKDAEVAAAPEEQVQQAGEITPSVENRTEPSPDSSACTGKRPRRPYQEKLVGNASDTRSSGKWMLAAAVTTVRGKESGDRPYVMCSPGPARSTITDLEFAPPVSVGVSLHKELNKTFGLETGLVYSYLSTTYKGEYDSYEGGLKLHYIGIPLSVSAKIWKNDHWKVYVSGGGMVEKGVQASVTKYSQESGKTNHRTESIDGLQWSVHLSAGIAYCLPKNWEIYVEPKLSHYFNNDQPVSIRTEKPTLPGIAAGLRYAF